MAQALVFILIIPGAPSSALILTIGPIGTVASSTGCSGGFETPKAKKKAARAFFLCLSRLCEDNPNQKMSSCEAVYDR